MFAGSAFAAESRTVRMLDGERWWGVANAYGSEMPFDSKSSFKMDLRKSGGGNQFASFLLSDRGRVIWCEDQTEVLIENDAVTMRTDKSGIEVLESGGTLRDAFIFASSRFFPPSGKMPDALFFSSPQYNTWNNWGGTPKRVIILLIGWFCEIAYTLGHIRFCPHTNLANPLRNRNLENQSKPSSSDQKRANIS